MQGNRDVSPAMAEAAWSKMLQLLEQDLCMTLNRLRRFRDGHGCSDQASWTQGDRLTMREPALPPPREPGSPLALSASTLPRPLSTPRSAPESPQMCSLMSPRKPLDDCDISLSGSSGSQQLSTQSEKSIHTPLRAVFEGGLCSDSSASAMTERRTSAIENRLSGPERMRASGAPVPQLSAAWAFDGEEDDLVRLVEQTDAVRLFINRRAQSRKLGMNRAPSSKLSSRTPVLSPSSPSCFFVHFGGVMCFLLDVVFSPTLVFYSDPSTTDSIFVSFMVAVSRVTCCFWTLTLPVGFMTSFYNKNGKLEQDAFVVATNYLRTLFLHDFALVVLDWVALFSSALDDNTTSALRALRFLRVLRALRVNAAVTQVLQQLRANAAFVAGLKMFKYFLTMLLLAHLVACGWYTIGLHSDRSHFNWLDTYDMRERSVNFRIFSSWHWALAQFGPTKMSHLPTNTFERGFAVIVAAVAMVVNPFLVSKITSSMVTLENLQREQRLRLQQLFSYLHRHCVSVDLETRICKSLAQGREADNRVQAVLQKLPMELYVALKLEIMSSLIRKHAILLLAVQPDFAGAAEITMASDGTEDRLLSAGEKLFSVGQKAGHMHFLIGGEITYQLRDASSSIQTSVMPEEAISQGMWLSEQSLWLAEWQHCGVAFADRAGSAEVLSLSAAIFQRAFPHSFVLKRYAKSFFSDSETTFLTDVGSTHWIQQLLENWFGVPQARHASQFKGLMHMSTMHWRSEGHP